MIGLGGELHSWSSSFMGFATNPGAIRALSVDLALISTSVITGDICYHQAQ